jgi:hypothetical protein
MESLWRKVIGGDQIQLTREAMCPATGNVIGVGLPKPIGTPIAPLCALEAGHRSIGFNVYPAGFWCCFGPILSCYSSGSSLLEWEFLLCAIVS